MKVVTKRSLGYFYRATIEKKGLALIILALILVTIAIDIGQPLLFKNFVDLAYSTEPDKYAEMYIMVWQLTGLEFATHTIWRILSFVNNRFQPQVMQRLQQQCFESVIKHSQGFFSNNFAGRIVARVNRFAPAFENVADAIMFNFIRVALKVVFVVVLVSWWWPVIGVAMLVWALSFIVFVVLYSVHTLKYGIAVADGESQATAHLSDAIANSRSVILFANRGYEINIFSGITKALMTLRTKAWDMGNFGEIFQSISIIILQFISLYYGVYYLSKGMITGAGLVLLQFYINQIFDLLWQLGRNIKMVFTALANANEMTEMLMESPEIVDCPNANDLVVTTGKVEFKNVGFAYNGSGQLIKDLNLTVHSGEKIALVGHSGAGKTTMVKLLHRLTDVTSGEILIDGQNIKKVRLESLYKNMTLVPQDPELLHRSLGDNISYGRHDATLEEIISASKAAHCHEFIDKLSEGYDTFVGERGVKLSGGERQRVAIARAILCDSPIIVLDEATSSLDSESELLIQEALHNLMLKKTVIVIAHRLSTIKEMDRIVVVESGGIVEQGKHEELINKVDGIYRKLWNIQIGGFLTEEG